MDAIIEAVTLGLHQIGAVKFGRFTLASGQTSPIYMDLRLLISAPSLLQQVAELYARRLETLEFDLLGAIPYAGLPIGVAVSLVMNRPLIFPRKEAKTYGTGKRIEGQFQVGQTVAVVEDLVTSAGSVLRGIALLKAAGLHVQDVVVLLDRGQGGRQNLQENGYTLHSVLSLAEMLTILEQHGRITARQEADVLAALS
ncbi:MAG: orotate phosphoribosyltransferase [Anaerolineales bacterium]|nr:orotate phosphoribosyltransferase [Anaerolineales bacterium]MCB8961501.1 orotate phosphoribosyltransferase [Ardenticatenales bacterium]